MKTITSRPSEQAETKARAAKVRNGWTARERESRAELAERRFLELVMLCSGGPNAWKAA
ncbi:hypothetical protein Pla108_15940 [Botrimarina colliarenosi]|uniref:Uncharacterized protein n=1 Tax=Botrimarina colliarenosi TaxID=2528001 RepID=A0A5C6ANQ2_9BACT|nr:hypothetical protein [Botrimarina colliarenosi]TWU00642.1 hypothetical protein Pla108_15940 [Botrimarina colliarenosi]